MKILIMGCGRVGARLASLLDEDGHEVTILDIDTYSFRRLPPSFGGTALYGNGIDEEALKKAGIEDCDVFVALMLPAMVRIMPHFFSASIRS